MENSICINPYVRIVKENGIFARPGEVEYTYNKKVERLERTFYPIYTK